MFLSEVTQSPIEDKMLAALIYADWPFVPGSPSSFVPFGDLVVGAANAMMMGRSMGIHLDARAKRLDPAVKLFVQAPVLHYFADILVVATPMIFDEHRVRVVVECDGRKFHSSDEQQRKDRERDKDMKAHGFWVMRFTGSDIHRDPRGCARSVVDCVMSIHGSDRRRRRA